VQISPQVRQLHFSVGRYDFEAVEEIIDELCTDDYAYDEKGQSVVAKSLEVACPEIYDILIESKFKLGPHENFTDFMKKHKTSSKHKFFEVHRKKAIKSDQEYLMVLLTKCKLHFTTSKEKIDGNFGKIMRALIELNQIPTVSTMLKLISLCERLEIIFDFDRESVDGIDPKKTEDVLGSNHVEEFCITIGGKLLDDGNCFEVYGTMAHEFCHYALKMAHDNQCKPYAIGDYKSARKFQEIVEKCKFRMNLEEVVFWVFEDESEAFKQHAELIVRVPHILARYKKTLEKVENARKNFPDLFNYFETQVITSFDQTYHKLKLKHAVKSFNESFDLFSTLETSEVAFSFPTIQNFHFDSEFKDGFQVFVTNSVSLTMKKIHQKAKAENFEILFLKLKALKIKSKMTKFEDTMASYGVSAAIDCDGLNQEQVTKLVENFIPQARIIFVMKQNITFDSKTNKTINHSWEEFDEESKVYLLNREVTFQGKTRNISDVWKGSTNNYDWSTLFDDLVNQREIAIGLGVEFEDETYVARKFVSPDDEVIEVNRVVDIVEDQRILLLSEEPGLGKSTEFKALAVKMKEKFSDCWIVLVDLKQHTKTYVNNKTVDKNLFNRIADIADFIAEKVLNLESYQNQIFKEMFASDRVVVMLDGADEISPTFNKFFTKLVTGISEKTRNQLWIATRPYLAMDLENSLQTDAWRIKEFIKEDQQEFFEKFLKAKGGKFDVNQLLSLTERIENESGSEVVSNPLFLSMIASLATDDPDDQLKDGNLHTIYDKCVDKMLRNFISKGAESKNDNIELLKSGNLMKIHQIKAITTTDFDDSGEPRSIRIRVEPLFGENPEGSVDQLNRVGLMFNDGTDTFYFIHKSFKEFFVAQVICEKVFQLKFHTIREMDVAVNLLEKSIINIQDSMIPLFCEHFLDKTGFSITTKNSKNLRKLRRNFELLPNLQYFAVEHCCNIIKFICLVIQDKDKVLNLWNGSNFLEKVLGNLPLENVKKMWKFMTEFFTPPQLKALLMHTNEEGFKSMDYAIDLFADEEVGGEIFKFLLPNALKVLSEDDVKESVGVYCKLLLTKNWDLETILVFYQTHFTESDPKVVLLEHLEDYFRFLCQSYKGEKFGRFCEKFVEIFGEDRMLHNLNIKDDDGRTVLMSAAENKDESVFETLWQFVREGHRKQFLTEIDSEGKNLLYSALKSNKKPSGFEFILNLYKSFEMAERRKIFSQEAKGGENVLIQAARYENHSEVFKMVLEFFRDMNTLEELMEMLIKQKDSGMTVFGALEKEPEKFEVFKMFLLEILQEVDPSPAVVKVLSLFANNLPYTCTKFLFTSIDSNSKIARFLSSFGQHSDDECEFHNECKFFQVFREFLNENLSKEELHLFLTTNSAAKTQLMEILVRYIKNDFILVKFLVDTFGEEIVKMLLKHDFPSGSILVDCDGHEYICLDVVRSMKSLLDEDEIKRILKNSKRKGKEFFEYVLIQNRICKELVQEYWSMVKDDETFKEILIRNLRNFNIFGEKEGLEEFVTQNCFVESFWMGIVRNFDIKFIQRLFDTIDGSDETDFYRKMFNFRDENGKNVFDYARWNNQQNVYVLMVKKARDKLTEVEVNDLIESKDEDSSSCEDFF
jgi:hypothetical protein